MKIRSLNVVLWIKILSLVIPLLKLQAVGCSNECKSTTMNVFLRKTLLFALFSVSTIPLWGQEIDTSLTTYRDTPVEYTFEHHYYSLLGMTVKTAPQHGTLNGPVRLSGNDVQLTYIPDPGFTGTDSFIYTRLSCQSPIACLETWRVNIDVKATVVKAEQDITFAHVDSDPISIDVTANDFSTTGVLQVMSVPMVNNGSASVNADMKTISFQPDPGFEGIANFNYTVCDEFGVCDKTVVNVVVNQEAETEADTMSIFTNKKQPVPVLIPPSYDLIQGPKHGELTRSVSIVPQYTPLDTFVGTDYIEFQYSFSRKVVEINVLDFQRNNFARDDRGYTYPGGQTEIDILANDAFGYESCLGQIGRPKYGALQTDPDQPGVVTYQAPNNFVGIDEFTYVTRDPQCGEQETARVKVTVSNYEPAYAKFFMSTPKRTPLVIGYSVPIKDFRFELKESAKSGEVVFLQGQVDTTIFNSHITGYNLILYVPDQGIDSGLDEFELTYCQSTDVGGFCRFQKDLKIEVEILDVGNGIDPECIYDCIWAGDTNFDGIVNVEDLLPVGLYMGELGAGRSEKNLSQWYGQYGDDWQEKLSEDIDIKHIDTDGDSVITALDTVAIDKFYGNTHSMTAAKVPNYDFDIQLQGNIVAQPGDMVELDVVIGNQGNPAIDLYGFTFNLPYNASFFDPEQVYLDYLPSAWLNYNSAVPNMTRNNEQGLLETGFTRTSGIPITGFGKVAKLRIVIEEEIAGFRPGPDGTIKVKIGGDAAASGLGGDGHAYSIRVQPTTIKIKFGEGQEEPSDDKHPNREAIPNDYLKVFPNPAGSVMNLYLNGDYEFDTYRIMDMMGRSLRTQRVGTTNRLQVDVSDLQTGMYLVQVQTEVGPVTKRIRVQR